MSFNQDQSPRARARRLERLHAPYHADLDRLLRRVVQQDGRAILLSLHSFTPTWRGRQRPMEVGVLFDRHEAEAEDLARRLERIGLQVARNAPYSGRDGMIFSASHHGRRLGIPYVELELRQDRLASPRAARAFARRIAPVVAAWMDHHWPHPAR